MAGINCRNISYVESAGEIFKQCLIKRNDQRLNNYNQVKKRKWI